jgi:hypothetical protein
MPAWADTFSCPNPGPMPVTGRAGPPPVGGLRGMWNGGLCHRKSVPTAGFRYHQKAPNNVACMTQPRPSNFSWQCLTLDSWAHSSAWITMINIMEKRKMNENFRIIFEIFFLLFPGPWPFGDKSPSISFFPQSRVCTKRLGPKQETVLSVRNLFSLCRVSKFVYKFKAVVVK